MYDWIESIKKFWLTIEDIESMKKGDSLEVVLFDRNIGDVMEKHKPFKILNPVNAFDRSMYVHDHDMKGVMTMFHKKERPVPLKHFEFELEYAKGNWYPLTDNYLPAKDSQMGGIVAGKKTHWKDMPKGTHVGFRGPMVRSSDLKKMPEFYIFNEFL